MPKDILGFGIVGCGLVSQFHGKAIQAAAEGQLIAATAPQQDRLDKFCADFGCEAAASFGALLDDDRVDVVNVLTPNALHAQFAVPAMEAGKHVIVEKPPEMTLEKTDRMIAARDDNGVKVAISLQVRFRKPIEAMKRAIEEGRFGRMMAGDTYMKWFRPTDYYLMDDWRSKRDQGAGVTIQHAFHYIDLLYHLMGPVASVEAKMHNLAHPEVEGMAALSDAVTYVPLDRRRKRERGFNQAERLALAIGRETGLPLLHRALLKQRRHPPQAGLSRPERIKAVRGAFRAGPEAAVKGASLLLVDDVYTTGSTVRECSKTLLKGGAESVFVATVARA